MADDVSNSVGRTQEELVDRLREDVRRLERERALADGRAAWLDRLHRIAERLASELEVETVLDTIVQAVCEHGHWKRSCILRVDDQEMEVVAQHNLGPQFVAGYRLPSTGSITTEAARTRRPAVVQDVREATFQRTRDHAHEVGYRALVAVPLPLQQEHFVLNVYSEAPHSFGPLEIAYVSALASYAAIALHNAQLYGRIQRQNEMLRRLLDTHSQLIQMILHGNDLAYVTRMLGQVLDRPIAVFNRFNALLAATPDEAAWRGFAPAGSEGDGASPVSTLGLVRTLPLVVGEEPLGHLAIGEVTPQLSDLDRIAMEQGALMVSIEMMKEKTALDAEMRVRSDFLNDLLANHPSATYDRATFLGWDPSVAYDLLVVDVKRAAVVEGRQGETMEDAALRRSAASVARGALSRHDPSVVAVVHGDGIVVLAPVRGDGPATSGSREPAPAEPLAHDLHAALAQQFPDAVISVGVGRRSDNLSQIHAAYHEAYHALQTAHSLGRTGQVVTVESLGLYAMLFRQDAPADLAAFVERTLGTVVEHDERHDTSYVTTLHAYLNAGGNLRATARELHVHVNTLNYRLKRIEELFGIDLSESDSRLNLHVALKLHELARRSR